MTTDIKAKENSSISSETIIKNRRGLYPRLSLKRTLELPKAIYEIGQGEPIRRLKVFDFLHKSPNSGPSRYLVTVSSLYGLTSGGYKAEYLTLTDIGRDLVSDILTEKQKINLIYQILFRNNMFVEFVDYWKDKAMPTDELASDWLIRRFNISATDAKAYWNVIKDNILDFDLTEELSGKRVILSKEVAFENVKVESDSSHPNIIEGEKSVSEIESTVDNFVGKVIYGTAVAERDFKYGKARLILPKKMTKKERTALNFLIDGLVELED